MQVSPSGYYLDPELSLEEQREMLEGFYEEIRSEVKGRPGNPSHLRRSGPSQGPPQVSAAEILGL